MPSISLTSYFRANHLTFHPFILLASDFCVVHSLGELFSCQPFNSPSSVKSVKSRSLTVNEDLSLKLEEKFWFDT